MQSIRTAPGRARAGCSGETLPVRRAELLCFALWATSAVRALDRVRQRAAANVLLWMIVRFILFCPKNPFDRHLFSVYITPDVSG